MMKKNFYYGFGDTRRPDSLAIGVNYMLDKLLVISAYAIPAILLLLFCLKISKK